MCLLTSLDIVAYYSNGRERTTRQQQQQQQQQRQTSKTLPLPILSLDRGYPWWKEEEGSDNNNNNNNNHTHKQLLYYPLDEEDKTGYSHFASEYGDTTEDWSILLQRLSNAQELLTIVQTGRIPKLLPYQQSSTSTPSTVETEETSLKEPEEDDLATATGWNLIQLFVSTQSLTLLHGRQQFSSILSCISWMRCFLSIPKLRTNDNNNKHCVCTHCQKPCLLLPSKSASAKRYVASWDRFFSATLDALLGLLIAILLLVALRYTNLASYSVTIQQGSLQVLQDYIVWLERFPAGFKLNVQLTHNMGHEIRNLIGVHQQLLESSTLWNVEYCQTWGIPILAFVAATFGWTTFLAVVMDLWRLQIIYAIVLAFSFRNLYKAELYLLSALWRLFRGKKRNVLRQRTDSMQYDAMQLLVGTVGFCICIFLWTTIWVYYTFFMVWNVWMHLPLFLLWIVYSVSRTIPLGHLWWRSFRPNWFAKNVYVQTLKENNDDDDGDDDVWVTRLCTIAEPTASILGSSCLVPLKPLCQWWINFCLEALIPRSSNESPCSMPFASLLKQVSTTAADDGNKD
jgi:hypothetical protein